MNVNVFEMMKRLLLPNIFIITIIIIIIIIIVAVSIDTVDKTSLAKTTNKVHFHLVAPLPLRVLTYKSYHTPLPLKTMQIDFVQNRLYNSALTNFFLLPMQ